MQFQAPQPVADPTTPRRRGAGWRGITLSGMIAAAASGAGVAVGPDIVDALLPPDPYGEIDAEFGERMLDLPGFEERFGDLEDAAAAFDAGVELGKTAISRIDDATLLEWADLLTEVLQSVDVESCAAIARGTSPTDLDVHAVDLATYRRVVEIVFEMARLELANAPRHEVPARADLEAASIAFVEELGMERAQEIAKTNLASASDPEACSAIRDVFEAVNDVDGPSRIHLLRDIGETLAA